MKDKDKNYVYKQILDHDIEIIEAMPHPAHYKLNFSSYKPRDSSGSNVIYNLGMDLRVSG
jgi:hypothetical protein